MKKYIKDTELQLPQEEIEINSCKGKAKIQKALKLSANIALSALLCSIVLCLLLCPRDWLHPDAYSDNATDVIRILSLLEAAISVVIKFLNKKKIIIALLIVFDFFTLYKFISTFVIL